MKKSSPKAIAALIVALAASGLFVYSRTPSPSVKPQPMNTPAATPTLAPTSRPTLTALPGMTANPAIIEVSQEDRDALARLCWVETRGFDDAERIDACYSIVSTIMIRVVYELMSDGTIKGAFNYNCEADSPYCHFPAYAYNGCEGIIHDLCPQNFPNQMPPYRRIVDFFFDQNKRGSCSGYLFYGSRREIDPPECVIQDDYGSFINFHRKVEP